MNWREFSYEELVALPLHTPLLLRGVNIHGEIRHNLAFSHPFCGYQSDIASYAVEKYTHYAIIVDP